MTRALLLVTLLVAGCDFNLFNHHGFPDGLMCASDKSCPPNGQQCTGESLCRFTCKSVSDCLPQNLHGEDNTGQTAQICDVDGFCRYKCQLGQTGGGGCQYQGGVPEVCDSDNVCRVQCSASMPCGMGFTCDSAGACRPM